MIEALLEGPTLAILSGWVTAAFVIGEALFRFIFITKLGYDFFFSSNINQIWVSTWGKTTTSPPSHPSLKKNE